MSSSFHNQLSSHSPAPISLNCAAASKTLNSILAPARCWFASPSAQASPPIPPPTIAIRNGSDLRPFCIVLGGLRQCASRLISPLCHPLQSWSAQAVRAGPGLPCSAVAMDSWFCHAQRDYRSCATADRQACRLPNSALRQCLRNLMPSIRCRSLFMRSRDHVQHVVQSVATDTKRRPFQTSDSQIFH